MSMTWEQKFAALQALLDFKGDAALHSREPGDWYVTLPSVSIKEGGLLVSVGNSGATPQEAVEKTWTKLTSLPNDHYIVASACSGRRAVRWNGFMWAPIVEEK